MANAVENNVLDLQRLPELERLDIGLDEFELDSCTLCTSTCNSCTATNATSEI